MLEVWSCWVGGRFLFGECFWIRVVFLFVIHSNMSVFVSINSFRLPVCREWRWFFFKPVFMFVCHYGLVFSNFVVLEFLWINRGVFWAFDPSSSSSTLFHVAYSFDFLLCHLPELTASAAKYNRDIDMHTRTQIHHHSEVENKILWYWQMDGYSSQYLHGKTLSMPSLGLYECFSIHAP